MENIQESISALESRQLELLGVMQLSDAHAAKCVKLGLDFREQYPDDYAAYNDARDEYNKNELQIAALYAEMEETPQEPIND